MYCKSTLFAQKVCIHCPRRDVFNTGVSRRRHGRRKSPPVATIVVATSFSMSSAWLSDVAVATVAATAALVDCWSWPGREVVKASVPRLFLLTAGRGPVGWLFNQKETVKGGRQCGYELQAANFEEEVVGSTMRSATVSVISRALQVRRWWWSGQHRVSLTALGRKETTNYGTVCYIDKGRCVLYNRAEP